MPTARRRHAITETARVEHALALAARRWPEDEQRAQRLLLHLIDLGAAQLAADEVQARSARVDMVRQARADLAGCYADGYLAELREDWPA